MVLPGRQKLILALLALYWPAIFILLHMRLPQVVRRVAVSDKTIHYLAYFVLVFLLWCAISPEKKVNWRKSNVWWLLFVVVCYGVFDEWLQDYVGRGSDVRDFLADVAGGVTSLIVLTIFPFWPACFAVTGATIFVLTNLTGGGLVDVLPVTMGVLGLAGYAFFSLLWAGYMYYSLGIKPPEARWLVGALALPLGFFLVVELFCGLAGSGFRPWRVVICGGGSVATVGLMYLAAVFGRRLGQKSSSTVA
jgi:VanZ family protein